MTDGVMFDATIMIGGFSVLAGAIGVMWKMFVDRWKSSEKKHEECEKKHDANQEKLLVMSGDLGELKGRIHTAEELGPKLNEIHVTLREMKED